MAIIELVEELQVAATTAPAKRAARKATSQQDKVEALSREDETPADGVQTPAEELTATDAPAVADDAPVVEDQDAEPPVNASGDKGAEGPGDQAEGEDTKA
jgi:large subunit ribosomal protein L17